MLGIVYTEFMEMVEDKFSADVLDDILETPGLTTDGSYTSVGYYDHTDMIRMVVALSKAVDVPVDDLIEAFGRHMFSVLSGKYPSLIEGRESALEVLESIDSTVHREVIKLYPQAELPQFKCDRHSPTQLTMHYRSKRPFSRLALGLIKGCGDHFSEALEVTFHSHDSDDYYLTEFEICSNND
jgi:hypothetical protein